jgi:hypothetical protein
MASSQRVFVHRTTDPRAPKFSIHDLVSGDVIQRDEVWLADAVFEVSPNGRYQSLIRHRRSVHAGVFGTLLEAPPRETRCDCPVRYRVGESPFFLNDEYRPVHEAAVVHFVDGLVFVPREDRWL